MKFVYPILLTAAGNDYIVDIPDFNISTEGKNIADAIDMARDAICLTGITYQDDNIAIPAASDIKDIIAKDNQILTLVDCDFDEYRKSIDNKAVKKNCTLPSWLNKKAEAAHINFSSVLQEALIEKLGLNN